MDHEITLAKKVKELRQKMDLTQNQVAEALSVTPGYISNVENGRTAMSLRILTYYAQLAGITLDSLVGLVETDYQETALINELNHEISKMSDTDKKKLLEMLKIWNQ